jgi:hypothetical protein
MCNDKAFYIMIKSNVQPIPERNRDLILEWAESCMAG